MKLTIIFLLLVAVATIAFAKPLKDKTVDARRLTNVRNNEVDDNDDREPARYDDEEDSDYEPPRPQYGEEDEDDDNDRRSDDRDRNDQDRNDQDSDNQDWNDQDSDDQDSDDQDWWDNEARRKYWDDSKKNGGFDNRYNDKKYYDRDYDDKEQQPEQQQMQDEDFEHPYRDSKGRYAIKPAHNAEPVPLNELPSVGNWHYNESGRNWYFKAVPWWPEMDKPIDRLPSIINWHYLRANKSWYYREPFSHAQKFQNIHVPLNDLPSVRNWHYNDTGRFWYFEQVPEFQWLTVSIEQLPSITNWRYNDSARAWYYDEDVQEQDYNLTPDGTWVFESDVQRDDNDENVQNDERPPLPKNVPVNAVNAFDEVDLYTISHDQVKKWIYAVLRSNSSNLDVIVSSHEKQGVFKPIRGSFIVIDADDLKWAAKDAIYKSKKAEQKFDNNVLSPFKDIAMDIYLMDKFGYIVRVEFRNKIAAAADRNNNTVPTKSEKATLTKFMDEANEEPKHDEELVVVAETTTAKAKLASPNKKPVVAEPRRVIDLGPVRNWHWNEAEQEWKWAKN